MHTPGYVRRVVPIALVIAFGVAAACFIMAQSSANAAESGRIAMFQGYGVNNPYSQANALGARRVANKSGITVDLFDGGIDSVKQNGQIQTAIATGKYKGFLIQAVDPAAVVPAVREAMSAGIKVGAYSQHIGPSWTTAKIQVPGLSISVMHPESKVGVGLGKLLISACGTSDPCRTGVILGTTNTASMTMLKYLKTTIAKAKIKISIVGTRTGLFSPTTAYTASQNLLTANPKLNVLLTEGDQMAVGAARAVKQAGRTKTVRVTGHGACKSTLAAIRAGTLFGTDLLLPYDEGRLSATALIKAMKGGDASPGIDPIAVTKMPEVVTAKNVSKVKPQWDC